MSVCNVQIGVQAGLFHGGKSLCESQKTAERVVSKDGNIEWEEDLTFDLKVCDIPRMARLCFVVYEILKSSKGVRARRLKDSKQVSRPTFKKIIIFVFCGYQVGVPGLPSNRFPKNLEMKRSTFISTSCFETDDYLCVRKFQIHFLLYWWQKH